MSHTGFEVKMEMLNARLYELLFLKVRHENLVNLIEFFRRKRRLYLVFEYVDHTVLDELEAVESGLDADTARSHIFQVIRGVAFCHENQIIHRDVKPENVLVSQLGVVKLCDFGFARILEGPNESCTDYVATRWYRAPELLVGDTKYGREVDIWAIGCLLAEILSGEPLFPGESDIDQLFHIIQTLGELSSSHQNLVSKNPMLSGLRMPNAATTPLSETFPKWSDKTMLFISECLDLTPGKRPSAEQLLKHDYFLHDSFPETFLPQLRKKVQQEFNSNLLIQFSNTRKSSGQNDKKQKKGKNDFYESHSQRVAPKPIQHLTGSSIDCFYIYFEFYHFLQRHLLLGTGYSLYEGSSLYRFKMIKKVLKYPKTINWN
ncbi:Cyclin-dependent kinase-like 2 [Armadillidium nasatum]|uniref:Cyclin-dependent kinase-like 2 n=1 Tax=Armadillidium nasatum TaxID=96803 RepID=A0A5N5SR06_9CRUS|nr:Cyclin-dependent kinase-like 2 [Armadillidium nasatum]